MPFHKQFLIYNMITMLFQYLQQVIQEETVAIYKQIRTLVFL